MSVVSSAVAVDTAPGRDLIWLPLVVLVVQVLLLFLSSVDDNSSNSNSMIKNSNIDKMRQQRKHVLDPILNLPVTSPVSSLCFVSLNANHDQGLTNSVHNGHHENNDRIDGRIDGDGRDSHSDGGDSDSDSDDEEIMFRSSAILRGETVSQNSTTSPSNSSSLGSSSGTAAVTNLKGRLLVTCHHDGDLLLWDLNHQRPTSITTQQSSTTTTNTASCNNNRGPGLAVRRTDNSSRFVYQTRDAKSTVSLHTVDSTRTTPSIIRSYESFSEGFCQVAPCCGNEHLLAMPYGSVSSERRGRNDDRSVMIVDHRAKDPAVIISILSTQSSRVSCSSNNNCNSHGMVTSLGLSVGGKDSEQQHSQEQQRSNRTILACGMESGTALFYDLAMPSHPIEEYYDGRRDFGRSAQDHDQQNNYHTESTFSTYSLGNEPILSMDLIPSRPTTKATSTEHHTSPNDESSHQSHAVLAVAGLAGDAVELERLSKEEIGRIVLFKATVPNLARADGMAASQTDSSYFNFQQRARLSTLNIDGDNNNNNNKEKSIIPVKHEKSRTKKSMGVSAGKPGVSICRFRPQDGRLFAVGGWDRRVRLFDRTHGKPMAILRGHEDSVSAFDWSHDADTSGFLASSGRGTKIVNIWQCFGSS